MIDRPDPGTYVHYKNGKHYTVIDVVRHSETEEWMVLYRAEYGDYGLWVRPLTLFMEIVQKDGQSVRRFAPLECSALRRCLTGASPLCLQLTRDCRTE
jgi:hypothetical protein